jgi:Asp-tRNA(Asn)/Glu-tRNA(Gln) amidotransferase A subunit family amidase
VRAVSDVNPQAREGADALDRELAAGRSRGPLHSRPVLVKDNIDTAGLGLVVLGKTNLNEWAKHPCYRRSRRRRIPPGPMAVTVHGAAALLRVMTGGSTDYAAHAIAGRLRGKRIGVPATAACGARRRARA